VFRKKYMTYLFEEKESVTDRTYLEVGQEIDSSLKQEINNLLGEEERVSLEATGLESFLYINTGYEPFGSKLSKRIDDAFKRKIPKKRKLEIDNAETMEWDELRSKLKLSESKEMEIKKLINKGKDDFAEVCHRETVDKKPSPFEYAVKLKTTSTQLDEDGIKKKFMACLFGKKEPVTNRTYLEAGLEIDRLLEKEINKFLSIEERTRLESLGINSFLYIRTGFDPFDDKLSKRVLDARLDQLLEKDINKYQSNEEREQLEPSGMNSLLNIKTEIDSYDEKLSEQILDARIRKLENRKGHKLKGYFCPFPFDYLTVCDNGDVYLCSACRMRSSIGNLNRNTLVQLWNSKNAVKMRMSIFDGSYKFCDENECEFLQDHKLRRNEEFREQFYKNVISKQLTKLETGAYTMEISYDKSCNLSCPYCRQEVFMSEENEIARLGKIHEKVFGDELKGLRRVMVSGCGDPLASKIHRGFLMNFDSKSYSEVRIKLQTNGLLLTPEMWKIISRSHCAIDWVSISIDAATADTYRINRGGNFDRLLKNLEFVSNLRKRKLIETFNINFVVQANNFREMKKFVELGKIYGCDYVVFQRIMNLGVDYGINSEVRFQELAIHLKSHPLHKEFLNVLNDPIFMDSRIGLFKLLAFFPEKMQKKKDVDSIIKYYPKCERNRIY